MSYASDLSQNLSTTLATLTPQLVQSPSPSASPSSTNLTAAATGPARAAPSTEAIQDRTAQLRNALAKLHPKHAITPKALAALIDDVFPPFQGLDALPLSSSTESAELVTLAQLAISSYGAVLKQLMEEAAELGEEDDWWARVESDAWQTGVFLVQSTPSRFISLTAATVSRLREITTAALHNHEERPSFLSLSTYRRAVPPSLFLTSVFPHLAAGTDKVEDDFGAVASTDESSEAGPLLTASRLTKKATRSLFFLTLSPLALTRQEIAFRRAEIRKARENLATRIGDLTLAAAVCEPSKGDLNLATLLSNSQQEQTIPTIANIKSATWTTILHLSQAISPSSSPSTLPTEVPPTPSDVAHSLSYLLTRTLPLHTKLTSQALEPLRRPPFLTRAWPYLLSVPVVTLILGRTVYNSRETLWRWSLEAGETIRSFLVDWVVEPVRGILETVRGGEGTGMTLMGKESLKSDLQSLERMVLDFGRDEYKLSEAQLAELGTRVREGDLTAVLKAWEQDIKSPIRSAVAGSLIRTLLIQVQKVKVDVALAMDGIEKMLHSQQLTFGFVGVAPSILVLYGFGSWARGMTRRDGGKKKVKEERRKCWMTLRQLDLLLSPPRQLPSPASPALTQGLLLLSLSSLRSYASSSQFPSQDTQLRTSFLEDVRALEDEGARAEGEARRVLLKRMWRWGRALEWTV
ncbi:ATP synthase regulation protein NCA2-domain-containing protein [Leucosporidium creatinivorum]|uniref:ATP synthase regulation protein NCA2-domain-containing protein n=1 Tax=Leucosporidium creatinivorum TaxID=106004 RepID=A0A1Y2DRV2_9BASI|nr:ATP synthase regulation protein NCA2-domain-containing protein [Leucosporidium creatinivorum]